MRPAASEDAERMIGRKLAHYRITERIGAGGMGVVYLAKDERLGRSVALKVLPRGAATEEGAARSRLLHEARAVSTLNHPHICTVYEAGEADGEAFIAMEYVKGRSLHTLIEKGGLPPETMLRYGIQIADALGHAHEHGVVHRDLKSSNVVVTPEGRAKVLDFGLAKRLPGADPHADLTLSDVALSREGAVVGTLPYMPPEVLRGETADARSDVWSFGVLIFEMATGELPFKGQTGVDLTPAILREPPPQLPLTVPGGLRAVIPRCLAKEPGERYQRAGEVRSALEAILSDTAIVPVRWRFRSFGPRKFGTLLAGLIVGLGLAGGIALLRQGRSSTPLLGGGRLTLLAYSGERAHDPDLSLDGKMVVYVATEKGRPDLFVGRVAGGGRVRLTEDDALESDPDFSPDAERIAYARHRPGTAPEICVIPALGGQVVTVVTGGAGPAWSPDGTRLAFVRYRPSEAEELAVANSDGTHLRSVLTADARYPFLRNPEWSPDGSSVAVVRSAGGIAGEIWIVPVTGGSPRRLTMDPPAVFSGAPAFTEDGRAVLHHSNRGGATNLWTIPISGGLPLRVTTGPGQDVSPSVARDGSIVFSNSRWRSDLVLQRLDTGETRTLFTYPRFVWAPALSPDGREIVFSQGEFDGSWHLWSVAVDGGAARQLTSGTHGAIYPRFTPDGRWILFTTWDSPRRIGRVPRAGGPSVLPQRSDDDGYADVSPDGRWIAFARAENGDTRVHVAPLGGGAARRLTDSSSTLPRWSPDGKWIAFSPDRSHRGGVSVIGADGTGERRLADTGGWPVWWPDGRKVGLIAIGADGNQEIRVVPLDGGSPSTLGHLRFTGVNYPFDVSRDGTRLVTSNGTHVSDEIWLLEPKK